MKFNRFNSNVCVFYSKKDVVLGHLDTGLLLLLLLLLVLSSAFFSASETGIMAVNRYRLRHLARQKHTSAAQVSRLLQRPDRILGVILIGNTFANVLASAIATILFEIWLGKLGLVLAPFVLTFVLLLFAEITPKTLAAMYSQQVAFITVWPLRVLLMLFYPVVWGANGLSNTLLKLFGVRVGKHHIDRLNSEELRTVILESKGRISDLHQDMLLRILDFQNITVDDVMIPRNEVIGIDLNQDWQVILDIIGSSHFTRLPLYEDDIDNLRGLLHVKDAVKLMVKGELNLQTLRATAREVYFIPENTPLHTQLMNFRKARGHLAMVVDEYGGVQGLVTIEDLVEELIGELGTEIPTVSHLVQTMEDGSMVVDGSVNIRELNRLMEWHLPTDGPKTLSGLIIEYLEWIPEEPTCLILQHHPMEILELQDNMVKSVKIFPRLVVSQERS